jgi:hypothetical protein
MNLIKPKDSQIVGYFYCSHLFSASALIFYRARPNSLKEDTIFYICGQIN